MHQTMGIKLKEMSFPSEEFAEGEEMVTRRCTSFGEAAIMIANDPDVFGTTNFFQCFYNGFTKDSTFQLNSWRDDEHGISIMKEIIASRILPANFTSGKNAISFGQVPPLPYFADKVQVRDAINNALSYNG